MLILELLLAGAAVALGNEPSAAPKFEDFPAPGPYVVATPKVDLHSHPQATRFRTILTRAAKEGPNFAGHFRVVEWGCGTGCVQVAIVDLISGKVGFPAELNNVVFPMPIEDGLSERLGFVYRVDSTLFLVNGVVGPVELLGAHYFQLSGGALVPLRVIPWEPRLKK